MDPLDELADLNLRSQLVCKPIKSQRKQHKKRPAEQPIESEDELDSPLHPLDALERANIRDRRQTAASAAVRPRVTPAAIDPSSPMNEDSDEESGYPPFGGSPISGSAPGVDGGTFDVEEPRVTQQQAAQAGLESGDVDADGFLHPLDQLADGKDRISAGMC